MLYVDEEILWLGSSDGIVDSILGLGVPGSISS